MKLLSHILAIAILIAVAVPCGDAHSSEDVHQTTCFDSDCDDNCDDDTDLCSPFCTCNCCQVSINKETESIKLMPGLPELNTNKVHHFHSRTSFSIWEPPPFK
ncbi:MAG: DUF6660 family protein [Bacteroidota bacterium]